MIKKSDFKSRLKVRLNLKFENIKNYLKKIYEKHCKFIVIFGFIIYLFVAVYSIILNYAILSIFLIIILPATLFAIFGEEYKNYLEWVCYTLYL